MKQSIKAHFGFESFRNIVLSQSFRLCLKIRRQLHDPKKVDKWRVFNPHSLLSFFFSLTFSSNKTYWSYMKLSSSFSNCSLLVSKACLRMELELNHTPSKNTHPPLHTENTHTQSQCNNNRGH